MRFNPMSDEEIDKIKDNTNSLHDGYADLCIKSATRGNAKSSGNPMIKFVCEAHGEHGGKGLIWINITIDPNSKFSMKRVKDFMYALGEERQYNYGEIVESDLIGKWFRALIRKQKASEFFDIAEFVMPARQNTQHALPPTTKDDQKDDDLPF